MRLDRSLKRAISLVASGLTPTLYSPNRIPKPKSHRMRTGRSIKLRIPLSQGRKYRRFHNSHEIHDNYPHEWHPTMEVRYAEVRKGAWAVLLDMFGFGGRIRLISGANVLVLSASQDDIVGPYPATLFIASSSCPTGLAFTTAKDLFHRRSVPCSYPSPSSHLTMIKSQRRSSTGSSMSSVSVSQRLMNLWRECRMWHGKTAVPMRAS